MMDVALRFPEKAMTLAFYNPYTGRNRPKHKTGACKPKSKALDRRCFASKPIGGTLNRDNSESSYNR